jgi:hypothetical protein
MSHRVSPSKVTIIEDANRSNSGDQDKTFKEQVIKPDQERYEARIQWLLEDEFGKDLPVLFRFNEMDLADEEQIARTRSYYMAAMCNNEVRELYGMARAGIDPETGQTEDPALEEFGRAPFEQSITPATFGAQGASTQPIFKSLAPQHREFAAIAANLGYIIDRIEEHPEPVAKAEGTPDYGWQAVADAIREQEPPTVVIEKGAIQVTVPEPSAPQKVVRDTQFVLDEEGVIVGKHEVEMTEA